MKRKEQVKKWQTLSGLFAEPTKGFLGLRDQFYGPEAVVV